jgi:hypothetical protein
MMSLGSSQYLMQAGGGRNPGRQDPDTDARRLFEQAYRHVGQPTRKTKIFGILEANEDDELITDVFSGVYAVTRQRLQAGDAPMVIIFREGLAYPEARLTLFRVVEEVSLEAQRFPCFGLNRPRNVLNSIWLDLIRLLLI